MVVEGLPARPASVRRSVKPIFAVGDVDDEVTSDLDGDEWRRRRGRRRQERDLHRVAAAQKWRGQKIIWPNWSGAARANQAWASTASQDQQPQAGTLPNPTQPRLAVRWARPAAAAAAAPGSEPGTASPDSRGVFRQPLLPLPRLDPPRAPSHLDNRPGRCAEDGPGPSKTTDNLHGPALRLKCALPEHRPCAIPFGQSSIDMLRLGSIARLLCPCVCDRQRPLERQRASTMPRIQAAEWAREPNINIAIDHISDYTR